MGLTDKIKDVLNTISGNRLTLESLYNTLKVLEEEVKAVKESGDIVKIDKLKRKIFKFLTDLKKEGIIVEFEREDGGGDLKILRWMKFDLDKMFKYVVDTINGIEKEVERRQKLEEGK